MEASGFLAKMQIDCSNDVPAPTVAAAYEQWVVPVLKRRLDANEISLGTIEHYHIAWKKHIEPRWADVYVTDVKPAAVQDWYDSMTRSQAEMARIPFRLIFDECGTHEVCSTEVAYRRYRMPGTSAQRDKGIWTLDELCSIWKSLRGSYMERWFILAAFGGRASANLWVS
ncbi:hypothetical protein [Coriobacterium glomerans]|uniref:hypothetical protein n=1 Tax=Coriobacterium glomerans TaxID=33871 RepID=UPI00059F8AF5|nr:hypothetical protein [Coriobacterium glomerans]